MVSEDCQGSGITSPNSTRLAPGPYRATKLWNGIVRKFTEEMQCKKHRRHFKAYSQCFTASDATDFLHEILKRNPNLGKDVTRRQTIHLLRKFLQHHVIEDVQGRYGGENFEDDGKLYRFPPADDNNQQDRQPLAAIDENVTKNEAMAINPKKDKRKRKGSQEKSDSEEITQENKIHLGCNNTSSGLDSSELPPSSWEHLKRPLPPVSSIPKCRVISPKITEDDIEEVWKKTTLEKVKEALQLQSLDAIISMNKINGLDVKHNATKIGKSGVVQVEKEQDIPYWALSAMTCLANWPKSTDTGLPCYPGFEKDVYKAVCDYFHGLEPTTIYSYGTAKKKTATSKPVPASQRPEPLLTYDYYELFTNTICLFQPESQDKAIAALRYTLLLLPPINRRKLHLLTRLLSKMCKNEHLEKLGGREDIRSLVLTSFSHTVMSCNEEVYLDDLLATRLLSFLIDHQTEIFKVPEELETTVEETLAEMRRPEVRYDEACEEIPNMQRVLATTHGAKVRLRQKSRINRADRNKRKSADLMKSWDKLLTTFKSRPVSHVPSLNNSERPRRPEHDTYLRMRLRSRKNRADLERRKGLDSEQPGPRRRTSTVGNRGDIPTQNLATSTKYLNADPESLTLDDGPGIKPAKSCSDICEMKPRTKLGSNSSEMGSHWNLKALGKPFSRLRKVRS